MTLGDQPIGWYSRRQDIISLSVTEAEYIASCEGAKDAAWAPQFLAEIGMEVQPLLSTDSEGSYNLTQTSRCLRRTRHIEHRYHYIRQQVQAGRLTINTIPGKNNPADIFTKLTAMSSITKWQSNWMRSAE